MLGNKQIPQGLKIFNQVERCNYQGTSFNYSDLFKVGSGQKKFILMSNNNEKPQKIIITKMFLSVSEPKFKLSFWEDVSFTAKGELQNKAVSLHRTKKPESVKEIYYDPGGLSFENANELQKLQIMGIMPVSGGPPSIRKGGFIDDALLFWQLDPVKNYLFELENTQGEEADVSFNICWIEV